MTNSKILNKRKKRSICRKKVKPNLVKLMKKSLCDSVKEKLKKSAEMR